ncbi:MAG: nitroreductase family protein, partial [Spirochaetota bacterium]
VGKEQLEQIVEAGILAPSGYNDQTTSFVVVTDPTLRANIAELIGNGEAVRTAQAIIAVVMDPRPGEGRDFQFGVENYAAATENMLLAISALGFASVWIDGALRRDDVAGKIGRLLDVPSELEVRVVLPVGVPAEEPRQASKKPLAERAWFNEYGAGATGPGR